MVENKAEADELQKELARLVSDDRQTRLEAIDALSKIGDAETLETLRKRLRLVSREHQTLIIAIGELRWRLSGTAVSSLDQH